MAVLMSVVVWGLILWALQWIWAQLTGEPDIRVDTALLYSWGAVTEVHPPTPVHTTFGQVSKEMCVQYVAFHIRREAFVR